jgi:hypothetical protein
MCVGSTSSELAAGLLCIGYTAGKALSLCMSAGVDHQPGGEVLLWLEQWFRACVTCSVTCVQPGGQKCLELVQF